MSRGSAAPGANATARRRARRNRRRPPPGRSGRALRAWPCRVAQALRGRCRDERLDQGCGERAQTTPPPPRWRGGGPPRRCRPGGLRPWSRRRRGGHGGRYWMAWTARVALGSAAPRRLAGEGGVEREFPAVDRRQPLTLGAGLDREVPERARARRQRLRTPAIRRIEQDHRGREVAQEVAADSARRAPARSAPARTGPPGRRRRPASRR